MSLAHVVPGRYTANIKDWGIVEKEINGDEALEAWISFDFKDQNGGLQSITWKKLVMTKDGERAKNVNLALAACGMEPMDDDGNVDMVAFMDSAALDMKTPVDITIVDQPSRDGSQVYKNVEWVNKVGGGQRNKMTSDEKLTMEQKLVKMGLGKKKPKVKNHAPGAGGNVADERDEIPF